ncbi:MAG: FAD-binding oxidoreductase [Candidatus Limnocylindria bacterium]
MDAAVSFRIAAAPADLTTFAACLRGTLVRPGDAAFEEDRLVWNVAGQGMPRAIVRAADSGDVATAIEFARSNDIEIAVRSGGHSLAGHSSGDDVLVIDTRDLRGLHIDPERRLAWAGAGLTAGEYTAAAAAHGLATPFGDTGSVGIAGLTLGGGIGWLARKHGLAVDALVEAEVVTADGVLVTTSENQHPDLFWAIRGGGGNFGIVTRFTYRLYPVEEILGGALFLPPTRDVLRSLVPIAASAPEELTTIGFVMPIPPVPFVADEHHGKLSLVLMFVYAGDPDAGRAAIAPFRAVATPYAEAAMPMPYPGIYEFTAEGATRHPNTTRSVFMDVLDEASVDAIVDALADAPPMSMVQIRVLGGAMGRVASDATAFAHRDASVMVSIMSGFMEPEMEEAATAWNRSLFAALEPKATGVYANFLEDEGDERTRVAYPGDTYERLASIKRRYDPANIFHRNQNIRPA